MRVVVRSYGIQGLRCGVSDPFRRRKVHIPLTEIDAIRGQVGSTTRRQSQVSREEEVKTYLKMDHTSCAKARPSMRRDENGIETGLR